MLMDWLLIISQHSSLLMYEQLILLYYRTPESLLGSGLFNSVYFYFGQPG
jgi:hypothetical protein